MKFCQRLIAIGLLFFSGGALAQVSGDVDGSGTVTPTDAAMLISHLLDVVPLNASQEAWAECNGQAGLDAGDLVWILNHEGFPVPATVPVPAGSFAMGDPWSESGTASLPVHTVTLSTYEIGQYEVTNAEYVAFLTTAAAGGELDVREGVVFLASNGTDPLLWTDLASRDSQITHSEGAFGVRRRDGLSMDDHPVVMVSWCGGAAYCNWLSRRQGHSEVYTESGDWPSDLSEDGYHLPTEAQWERAAAWDPEHSGSNTYPIPADQAAQGHWRYGFTGDSISEAQANIFSSNPLGLTAPPYTTPVGHFSGSVSSAGCQDMSGNVWELCNDWSDFTYYSFSPENDPEGPQQGIWRVMRGGSWLDSIDHFRSSLRGGVTLDSKYPHVGFRVARNP